MKEIEFLPLRFRERESLRRAMIWRVGMLGLFSLLVLTAHVVQAAVRRSLNNQLNQLSTSFAEASVASARLSRLRDDLRSGEQFAELYTYLEHPWPRTQLLAAVTQTLPASLALTELHIDVRTREKRNIPPAKRDSATKLPPPVDDLQTIREEVDGAVPEVVMRGITKEVSALHTYVAGFSDSPFFSAAKLESIESLPDTSSPDKSRFELRLFVRPGYGQAGGPGGPPVNSAAAAKTASRSSAAMGGGP